MNNYNSLVAACLAGLAALPSTTTWAGALDMNRNLIIINKTFPADKYILDQACVMIELYHCMDEHQFLLYDPEAPEVVFGKVSVRNLSSKPAEDSIMRTMAALKLRIHMLIETPEDEWDVDQKTLRKLFPTTWTEAEISASADRMINRGGMRRSFRVSLENSSRYQQLMDSAFRAEGIPTRLKYLAHVESRFNPEAVSGAGAAGIWQLLKGTSSPYLVIDDRVDQRMDPRDASQAAAKFLKHCHRNLASWPLAIMAYNNGPAQMRDAVKETGSLDASQIIQNYQGGGFGNLSRNYYAMFLAASSLAMKAESLYPSLRKQAPIRFKTLKLEHEWTPRQLRILSGYSTLVIMHYNPALRPIVFDRNLLVPKGFKLKLPAGLPTRQDQQFADLRLAIAVSAREASSAGRSLAGFPVPRFAENTLRHIRKALFPFRRDDAGVMAYMHSQGLLEVDRLALAKQDRILIEPHPALQATIRGMGG